MYVNTTGLILRETAYKDSSKILTVLTGDEGKLTVSARGALRKNSKLAAVTQLLAFSEMTLSSNRDRWTLTEAHSLEQFIGLRNELELLALGAYFAELTEAAADEDSPTPELLSLCLNALYAMSEGLKAPEYVKPAFELRLMSLCGYAPLISYCAVCGSSEAVRSTIDIDEGVLYCETCSPPGNPLMSNGALSAARYILSCDNKKLFSFRLETKSLVELGKMTERYLLARFERSFRTLDFLKGLRY